MTEYLKLKLNRFIGYNIKDNKDILSIDNNLLYSSRPSDILSQFNSRAKILNLLLENKSTLIVNTAQQNSLGNHLRIHLKTAVGYVQTTTEHYKDYETYRINIDNNHSIYINDLDTLDFDYILFITDSSLSEEQLLNLKDTLEKRLDISSIDYGKVSLTGDRHYPVYNASSKLTEITVGGSCNGLNAIEMSSDKIVINTNSYKNEDLDHTKDYDTDSLVYCLLNALNLSRDTRDIGIGVTDHYSYIPLLLAHKLSKLGYRVSLNADKVFIINSSNF